MTADSTKLNIYAAVKIKLNKNATVFYCSFVEPILLLVNIDVWKINYSKLELPIKLTHEFLYIDHF